MLSPFILQVRYGWDVAGEVEYLASLSLLTPTTNICFGKTAAFLRDQLTQTQAGGNATQSGVPPGRTGFEVTLQSSHGLLVTFSVNPVLGYFVEKCITLNRQDNFVLLGTIKSVFISLSVVSACCRGMSLFFPVIFLTCNLSLLIKIRKGEMDPDQRAFKELKNKIGFLEQLI